MAGYSGTPLAKKLGLKASQRIALVNAPPSFPAALEPLPADLSLSIDPPGREIFDLIVLFCPNLADLRDCFPRLAQRLTSAGALWVAWPKRASGVATDLTEDVVRTVGLAAGLVDNKVCAIDPIWSGLRFVCRLKDRAARRPPTTT
jgi:hypothetical protein